MGRKFVEATNAWRMRRTRGDMGRLRLLAAAARDCAVPDFLFGTAAALLDLADDADFFGDEL
jgi:hypothetical protein